MISFHVNASVLESRPKLTAGKEVTLDFSDPVKTAKTRRSHKKSRLGCLACKAGRVKCDEVRPRCTRCFQKSFTCKYDRVTQDSARRKLLSQPTAEEGTTQCLSVLTCSPLETVATLVNGSLTSRSGGSIYGFGVNKTFEAREVMQLRYFQDVICETFCGVQVQKVYKRELLRLAVSHPYLMHAILAMTSQHIRLTEGRSPRLSSAELYHWQCTLSTFNKKVAPRISHPDADGMLTTATLINGFAFAMIDCTDPYESWPLTTTSTDLQWLSLQGGIGIIFAATQPLSNESVLRDLFHGVLNEPNLAQNLRTSTASLSLPLHFAELYNITPTSSQESNPYLAPLCVLAGLLRLECTAETILTHLSFIASLPPSYLALLQLKDHRALLILAYWYAILCSFDCWWTSPRSKTECAAICIYLEKYASNDIQRLLSYPAQACGYQLRSSSDDNLDEPPQILIPCRTM